MSTNKDLWQIEDSQIERGRAAEQAPKFGADFDGDGLMVGAPICASTMCKNKVLNDFSTDHKHCWICRHNNEKTIANIPF